VASRLEAFQRSRPVASPASVRSRRITSSAIPFASKTSTSPPACPTLRRARAVQLEHCPSSARPARVLRPAPRLVLRRILEDAHAGRLGGLEFDRETTHMRPPWDAHAASGASWLSGFTAGVSVRRPPAEGPARDQCTPRLRTPQRPAARGIRQGLGRKIRQKTDENRGLAMGGQGRSRGREEE